jgi:hypothetical protein
MEADGPIAVGTRTESGAEGDNGLGTGRLYPAKTKNAWSPRREQMLSGRRLPRVIREPGEALLLMFRFTVDS